MIELKNIDHFCILVGKLDISKRYYMQIFSGIFKIHPKDSKTLMFESEMVHFFLSCLLYTSPSPRDVEESRMPSSA